MAEGVAAFSDPIVSAIPDLTDQVGGEFLQETTPGTIGSIRPVTDGKVAPYTLDNVTVVILSIFSYVIGSMLFAPLIPNFGVLIVYILVLEVLIYIAYRIIGWAWNPLLRLLSVSAVLVGYFIGELFYRASIAILGRS